MASTDHPAAVECDAPISEPNTMAQTHDPVHLAETTPIPDVQGRTDRRRVAIDRVGVKGIRYPITVETMEGGHQAVDATFNMYVSLAADRKGTHMSRFLELLNDFKSGMTPDRIIELCHLLRTTLDADRAHVEMTFTYFVEKTAPASGKKGLMDYTVRMVCDASTEGDSFILGVAAPATSLCPCSKEISEYGAHNQRCLITADITMNRMVWIEELIELIESSASCPVYSVLKRPDEKVVTEQAFDNPKFVEDIVRDLAGTLDADDRIDWFRIHSENFESIHSHNAYAEISRASGLANQKSETEN
jgi:GTP cyclohydrolase I|tara:strand:- start:1060 stop:1971 length:912 start_codon:yes stop_codon:yes gene_type:complete